MTEPDHRTPRRRFPWLRSALLIVYGGLVVAAIYYEINAQEFLRKGDGAETEKKYLTAQMAYKIVVEKYPLSFAVTDALQGLERIGPALQDSPLPDRLRTTVLEDAFGERFDPYLMDWLPFLAPPLCGAMLVLVFLSRIRRRGLSFLAFLLLALAGFGTLVQLAYYGFFQQRELADIYRKAVAHPAETHIATYVLAGLVAIMTLTRRKSLRTNN